VAEVCSSKEVRGIGGWLVAGRREGRCNRKGGGKGLLLKSVALGKEGSGGRGTIKVKRIEAWKNARESCREPRTRGNGRVKVVSDHWGERVRRGRGVPWEGDLPRGKRVLRC